MYTQRAAAAFWFLGAAACLVCEALAAVSAPGYSYVQNYISDLGVAPVMNIGAFVVHGALFLLGAVVVTRGADPALSGRGFVAAAAVNMIGNVVIAVYPSHVPTAVPWHGIGAGLAIIGGNVAILLGGRSSRLRAHRWTSTAMGVFGLACLVAVVSGAQPAGLIERGSVYTIVGWELLTAVVLFRGRSR